MCRCCCCFPIHFQSKEKTESSNDTAVSIDIYGADFQPVVVLHRLLPEEIVRMTRTPDLNTGRPVRSKRHKSDDPIPTPKKQSPAKVDQRKNKSGRLTSGLFRRPKTVQETREMLRLIHEPNRLPADTEEDEASRTAGCFQNRPVIAGIKLLTGVSICSTLLLNLSILSIIRIFIFTFIFILFFTGVQ